MGAPAFFKLLSLSFHQTITRQDSDTVESQTLNFTKEPDFYRWFINASEIAPGDSAIIGNNRVAFYTVHHLALTLIIVSLVASVVVIFQIHSQWKRNSSKVDFPIRFPLYLAIADTLWGISIFINHIYLVTVQTFPGTGARLILSISLWFFFGYQQLMQSSIAGYTYLRVVHCRKLDLGIWEWKLHSLWFIFLTLAAVLFGLLDSFGNAGYWVGYDPNTINGQFLGFVACLTSTFNAFTTTLGYWSIRRTVVNTKNNLRTHEVTVSTVNNENGNSSKIAKKAAKQESVASQCLATHVYVAACIYIPFTILLWINVILQIFMGVVEPLSCLLIVIVANCRGLANAYGYFHNEGLKKGREAGCSKDSSCAMRSAEQSLEDSNSSH